MARNKYPEVTVKKILEVAERIFWEKGYDDTTIQNIIDGLGGLTKGAVYHHFKSKEEILDALGNKMFCNRIPFEVARERKDLNGIQKMRMVIMLQLLDKERVMRSENLIPVLDNPHILAGIVETNCRISTPFWREFIEEGITDGSIHTQYVKELPEVLSLLDLWIALPVYPSNAVDVRNKFLFLNGIGIPLLDEQIITTVD